MNKIIQYPYNLADRMLRNIENKLQLEKLLSNLNRLLFIEVMFLLVISFITKGINDLLVSAYQTTIIGWFTSLLFSIAANNPQELFAWTGLVTAGIVCVSSNHFNQFLEEKQIRGIKLYIHNILFVLCLGILLSGVIYTCAYLIDKIQLFEFIFYPLGFIFFLIGLSALLQDIKLMFKTIFVGILLEYALVFVLIILGTLVMLLLGLVFKIINNPAPLLYMRDLMLSLRNMLRPENIPDLAQNAMVSLVFLWAYIYMNKREKRLEELRKDNAKKFIKKEINQNQ